VRPGTPLPSRRSLLRLAAAAPLIGAWTSGGPAEIETIVAEAIRPVMARYAIPGMAVGLVAGGRSQVFDHGVMSRATGEPVTGQTLFEIGSVSKTFTATLAAYGQVTGKLSLTDTVSKYLPLLRGGSFDRVSLINLGTHTAGGFPLQVPDEVTNTDQLMAYLQQWTPSYAPGTHRTYANPSVGLLGMIAARSMNADFAPLMESTVFHGLGLTNTYLEVPAARQRNYAQGYTKADAPIRMTPGMLALETYGVRTTAADMLRFLRANMRMVAIDGRLQSAITATHTGYYRLGAMTQDLIWEQYGYPSSLPDLLLGNSAKVSAETNPVVELHPPSPPRDDVLINKTGSTNGFGAYVAFVPAKKIGLVLLANKNYPNEARVAAAYEILTRL
jgi:beta-lactamase class C